MTRPRSLTLGTVLKLLLGLAVLSLAFTGGAAANDEKFDGAGGDAEPTGGIENTDMGQSGKPPGARGGGGGGAVPQLTCDCADPDGY